MRHTSFRRTLIAAIGIAGVLGVAAFADAHGGGGGGMGGGMGGGSMGGGFGGFGMEPGTMSGYGPQGGYGPTRQNGSAERGYGRGERFGPGTTRGYAPDRGASRSYGRDPRDEQRRDSGQPWQDTDRNP